MLIVLTLYLKAQVATQSIDDSNTNGELQVDPIQSGICQNHLKMCIHYWHLNGFIKCYKNGVCYLK